MSLYPISHRSTRNALREVIGKGEYEIANAALCERYEEQINRKQPVLLPGLTIASDIHLNAARLARSKDGFSGMGYLSGALIFFAATESQASHNKRGIKELSQEEFSAWRKGTLDTISQEDTKDILTAIHNMTSDGDLDKLKEASLDDFSAVSRQVLTHNMASY